MKLQEQNCKYQQVKLAVVGQSTFYQSYECVLHYSKHSVDSCLSPSGLSSSDGYLGRTGRGFFSQQCTFLMSSTTIRQTRPRQLTGSIFLFAIQALQLTFLFFNYYELLHCILIKKLSFHFYANYLPYSSLFQPALKLMQFSFQKLLPGKVHLGNMFCLAEPIRKLMRILKLVLIVAKNIYTKQGRETNCLFKCSELQLNLLVSQGNQNQLRSYRKTQKTGNQNYKFKYVQLVGFLPECNGIEFDKSHMTRSDWVQIPKLSIIYKPFQMQFDILNQLLTSTVSDLFKTTETTTAQSKLKVKQLEGLIKNQSVKRSSSVDSASSAISGFSGMNVSGVSQGSNKGPGGRATPLRPCKSVEEWIKVQAPLRLKESIHRLGITEQLLTKKKDLDNFVGAMSIDTLAAQKKKVKNELRCYDNDFYELFRNQPNHDEKQPFRPLYVYYKRLKQYIKDENHMSTEEIEKKIKQIKLERKDLRGKIEAYKQEFESTNNRRIKYERDIAPIKTQYNKYKDLKNQLLRLEQLLNPNK